MIRHTVVVVAAIIVSGCSQTSTMSTSLTTAASATQLASTTGAARMPTRGYAFPPPAFKPFCSQQPRLCNTSSGARSVTLTSKRQAELDRVNRSVNRRIRERSDKSTTGREDVWQVPSKEGDCEDFAILKKSELLRSGWPAASLLLTVATLRGEGHTVLTVRTDKGDLILDNRTNAVKNWKRTPYKYFARQSQGNSRKWTRIKG